MCRPPHLGNPPPHGRNPPPTPSGRPPPPPPDPPADPPADPPPPHPPAAPPRSILTDSWGGCRIRTGCSCPPVYKGSLSIPWAHVWSLHGDPTPISPNSWGWQPRTRGISSPPGPRQAPEVRRVRPLPSKGLALPMDRGTEPPLLVPKRQRALEVPCTGMDSTWGSGTPWPRGTFPRLQPPNLAVRSKTLHGERRHCHGREAEAAPVSGGTTASLSQT